MFYRGINKRRRSVKFFLLFIVNHTITSKTVFYFIMQRKKAISIVAFAQKSTRNGIKLLITNGESHKKKIETNIIYDKLCEFL